MADALSAIVQAEPALDKAVKRQELPCPLVNGEQLASGASIYLYKSVAKAQTAHAFLSVVQCLRDILSSWQPQDLAWCEWNAL